MNNIDKQYQTLLKDILDNGVKKSDRTGTGTLSVFGRQIRHKMSEGFPLLTTKKMHWKSIVVELLWFLRGDTNISYLLDNDCHIWDGDAYKFYLKNFVPPECPLGVDVQPDYYDPLTKEEFIKYMKLSKTDGKRGEQFIKKHGDLGPIYGAQWRRWKQFIPYDITEENCKMAVVLTDQIANLIKDLKENPDSRRLIVSAWNVGDLDQMALPPCHNFFQVYTRELSLEERKKLCKADPETECRNDSEIELYLELQNIPKRAISLMWNQRSVDTFLGLPFNIASYALLLEIFAKMVNMVPNELIGNLGDVHLYSNHIEQAKEQIGREYTPEERQEMLKEAMGQQLYNKAVNELMPFGGGMSEYYEIHNIPKRTREPYLLPKINLNASQTDAFWKSLSEDLSLFNHLEGKDWVKLENYQSHPTIKAPLSN